VSLRRLFSFVIKEIRQLSQDHKLMPMLFGAPFLQLLLFGYGVSTDLKEVKLGVVMESPSPQARELVRSVMASGAFELKKTSASPADLEPWLERGDVQIALHIPPDFSRTLARGEAPIVQVLSDGSDSNTATLAFQYLNGAALLWAGRERADRIVSRPEAAVRFIGLPQVEVETRYWYNPDLKSVNFQIPGVLVIVLLTLTMSLTSMMVVRERELGTLEQLSVTPIRGPELLLGKTIPVVGVGLFLAAMVTVIAVLWFRVPLRGSILFLFVCVLLFLLNTMGLGLLLSLNSRTQLQAQLAANFITTPLIMLSGFLFPIANMPQWAQWLTYIVPARYMIIVVRGVFLKGLGFAELWPQAAALAVLGTLFYAVGVLSFKKQVD
jgi:ABC-2 type transport system permease protein